ncbi:GNAT family N-acetyltransferase [Planomicrobium sp. CPCC 101110]|uniref:GNAT family N-acetyltransferase n=1 Tax=Planomicrobium sp. CPCC 101110 TaxID=2599619 RepID=UPI0011B54FAC|nr:GNAT family N-acetyltransferase [Planomicrobium sp. CPCC 101110]TWT24809.1 GNAT family N-acetyltransferase [Planomicrobium sp. CPCC 101110]
MDIHLQPVTRKNWEEALTLQVKEAQRSFTPSVAVSLAKIAIKPDGDHVTYLPFAIYEQDSLVGFIMHAYEEGTDNMYWINGFLIDEKQQGKGYGKAAFAEMVRWITKRFPECREIRLTVHKDNHAARSLYIHFGFRPTGEVFGEHEEVMVFSVN